MTCREFKHAAASLTLWELSRSQDGEILNHAEACQSCGAWLQKQRLLATSMQTLRARTAGREAGASVEQALLRAFRQVPRTGAAFATAGEKERSLPLLPVTAPRSTPVAMRLSRWFETGAYVAVAAAIVVSVFLGVRLLHDRQTAGAAQSQSAAVSTMPAAHQPDAAAQNLPVQSLPVKVAPPQVNQRPAVAAKRALRWENHVPATSMTASVAGADDSQTTAELGYMPLMFCDPLSCSSDTQVVRMELPQGQNAPPQVADVVVGYDGTVRAVRMVNY